MRSKRTFLRDRLSDDRSQFIVPIALVEAHKPNSLLSQILTDTMKAIFGFGREHDQIGMVGKASESESLGGLDRSMSGLNDPLRPREVFTNEGVTIMSRHLRHLSSPLF